MLTVIATSKASTAELSGGGCGSRGGGREAGFCFGGRVGMDDEGR